MSTQTVSPKIVSLKEAANRFLACNPIAVFGISRRSDDTAKLIYERLKKEGKTVFAIHPTESIVKGIQCHDSLNNCPELVEAAVVVTKPLHNAEIFAQAKAHGCRWIWLHKSFGNSVDPVAVQSARKEGLNVIDGGCPMMFVTPVDGAHKCFRHLMSWVGRIPRRIELRNIS